MNLHGHMIYLILLSTLVSSAALALHKRSISKERAYAGVSMGANKSTECEKPDPGSSQVTKNALTDGCPKHDVHAAFSVCRDERRELYPETLVWTNRSAADHKRLREGHESSRVSSLMQVLNQTVTQVHTLGQATWSSTNGSSTNGKWVLFGMVEQEAKGAPMSQQQLVEIGHWLCRMRALEIPHIVVCLFKDCADMLHASLPVGWKHSVLYLGEDYEYWKGILTDPKSYAFVVSLALVNLGYDNFFSDLDTYWNSNPYPVLQSLAGEVFLSLTGDFGDPEVRREHSYSFGSSPNDCAPGCIHLIYENLMWDVRGGVVEGGGPEGLGRSQSGVANSGLRFYKATEGARIALSETVLRATIEHQPPEEYIMVDQDVTLAAIKPLCGVEVHCGFLPSSFSQSNWDDKIHLEHDVVHLIYDDKVLWRYLTASLEDKGPASKGCSCSAEFQALEEFIVRSPSCHRSLTSTLGSKQMASLALQILFGADMSQFNDAERLDLQTGMRAIGCNASAQHVDSSGQIPPAWCKSLWEEVPELLHLLPHRIGRCFSCVDTGFNERKWRRIFAAALVCSVPPEKYLFGTDPFL